MPSPSKHFRGRDRDRREKKHKDEKHSNAEEKDTDRSRSLIRGEDSKQESSSSSSRSAARDESPETNTLILNRREKQLEYGRNTIDYEDYTSAVPVSERKKGMPYTPDKTRKFSRRQWDGLIKAWKIDIHNWTCENPHELRKKLREEAKKDTEEEDTAPPAAADMETEEKTTLLEGDLKGAVGGVAGKEELGYRIEDGETATPPANRMCGTLTSALGVMGAIMLATAIVLMGLVLMGF